MFFEPWMFAAMEEAGYMDTIEGRINRVAKYLSDGSFREYTIEEIREACFACNIDPDEFSEEDIRTIREKTI